MDRRQSGTGEGRVGGRPQQMLDTGSQQVPVEQLPFPDSPPVPPGPLQSQPSQLFSAPSGGVSPLSGTDTPPGPIKALIDPAALSNMDRQVQEVDTGGIPSLSVAKKDAGGREPVVIQRTWQKRTEPIRPPKGRRLVVHAAVTTLLVVIMAGVLLASLPTGSDAQGVLNIFKPGFGIVNTKSNNTALVESQAATATAVTQDGYDPGANTGQFAGIPTPPPDYSGTGNRFFYGQCTYWASMRYHQLTGKWVPWLGNAYQWTYGASSSGWIVSSVPKVPSIIVLAPGVQGSSPYYGHVAIVEKINSDGSVLTSNWNWAGSWGTTTMVTFQPGPGVSFLSAPGS